MTREEAKKMIQVIREAGFSNANDCAFIKGLTAQLAEYDEVAAEYGIDGKTMLTLAKSQLKTAQDNIKLREQLAASRRRERAAVEDLNSLRKRSGWKCYACKYDAVYERSICRGCEYNNDNNWEWRGEIGRSRA